MLRFYFDSRFIDCLGHCWSLVSWNSRRVLFVHETVVLWEMGARIRQRLFAVYSHPNTRV